MNRAVCGAVGALAVVLGAAAYGHSGATGVVKDRMDGMVAMREAVRRLSPIMQGDVPYNVGIVREGAKRISAHAGDALTKLFPEGSGGGVSYAKSNIWESWEEFATLSEELRIYSEGLTRAAENGLDVAAEQAGTDASSHGAHNKQRFTVAELMGYAGPEKPTTRTDLNAPYQSAREFARMGAADVFLKVSQTCSACHSKFRAN